MIGKVLLLFGIGCDCIVVDGVVNEGLLLLFRISLVVELVMRCRNVVWVIEVCRFGCLFM